MGVGVGTKLTAGHLTFTNLELSQYTGDAVISRSSYSVAGQRIAVKVAGDPVSGNNGLFFVYTDHLGSSSILSDLAGTVVTGSQAHYLPFGGYRGTAPTQTLTDRGYTGQRENLDLGLMYYNARYYLPGLGKFASADSIVPNPANPQAFNKYAYVSGNPLIYNDPTGHWLESAWDALNVGLGVVSLVDNIEQGNYGWAAIDAAGLIVDTAALVLPVIPAGASTAIKAVRAGDAAIDAVQAINRVDNVVDMVQPLTRLDDVVETTGDMASLYAARYLDTAGAVCSFSATTEVLTQTGLEAISQVELNELVWAFNEETGEMGWYPVVAVWSHKDPITVYVTIEGELIETTPEHPFFTTEGEWVAAATLNIGDEIRNATWDTGTVEAIELVAEAQTMYNFTVATAHTYFVGEGQWLVHNACADLITQNWKAYSVADMRCQNGCEAVADNIKQLIGGDTYRLSVNQSIAPGGKSLGPIDGYNSGWVYHDIVIKDGRVYDAFTGSSGQTVTDYFARWEYADAIELLPRP